MADDDRDDKGRKDNILRFAKAQRERPDWVRNAILGEKGQPLAVLASAVAFLEAEMPDHFAFDEMLGAPVLMLPLEDEEGFTRRPATDADVNAV
jgi:hypothetical protein